MGTRVHNQNLDDPNLQRWLNRDPLGGSPDIQLKSISGDMYKLNPLETFIGPNLYEYIYNSPLDYVDSDGLLGFGITGGVSAEAGVVFLGGAGTVSVGGGVFGGGPKGLNFGGFFSGGGFVGTPGLNKRFPKPCESVSQPPIAGGAYAGYGFGPFFTNAKKASDLSGPFSQWNFNLGVGAIKFSVSFAYSGGIGIGSVTFGQGGYVSGSGYPTTTITTK